MVDPEQDPISQVISKPACPVCSNYHVAAKSGMPHTNLKCESSDNAFGDTEILDGAGHGFRTCRRFARQALR